jgi:UDP-glucose 4-epimerase
VDEFTDGLLRVIDQGENREIYHIGTSEEVTIKALAELVGEVMGVRVRVRVGPAPKDDPSRRCPDLTKLEGLGYHWRTALEDGLIPTIEWYLENQPAWPAARSESVLE